MKSYSICLFLCGLFHFSQFSCSVMSDSLRPHGLQHTRLPCPSPTPGACSNSCPSSWWCHPTISSSVVPCPAFSLYQDQGLFQWVSSSHQVAKDWSFSFRISPSNEYSGLISYRIDSFYLLAVQGTLKSLLQHHSSKASILLHSAFFVVQLSHPYMTTGKTIALTRWTFVGNVMSLHFSMLCWLVIVFFQGASVLISWLQSPSAMILEPPNKVCQLFSTVSPSICHEVMGPNATIFVFWMLNFKPTFHTPLSLSSRGSLVLRFLW